MEQENNSTSTVMNLKTLYNTMDIITNPNLADQYWSTPRRSRLSKIYVE